MDNREGGTGAPWFRTSPDVVYNTAEDQSILVHMRTNQIYELNRTGARFWELLTAGHDRTEIRRLMMQEFDVTEAELDSEIEDLLTTLENEGLILRAP